jgi:hypothetical protein
MSPTRRQVVSALAAGAVVPASVTAASAQQDSEGGEFSPEITINSNNLVATIGERDGNVDPDTVTIYTADGSAHEFDGAAEDERKQGEAFDVGYTYDADGSRARIENWHGVIEQVTATKDGETVSETNDGERTLQVSCSLWQTPDEPPTEFTALSEGARKQHWNRGDQDLSADQRQYGSPGRPLWTVTERNSEIAMRVDFLECDPESEKALWFDCTTVTVTEDELNQGERRIEDVQLTFTDHTTEHPPGTDDDADNGAYELPVTLSGSGENDGKVIKKLHFKVPHGEYTYWNLEADQCSAESDGGTEGGEGSGGTDDGDGSDDGSQSSGGTETPSDGGPSSDDTGSDDPTATPEATGDGAGSSGGSSGGGGSGGSGSDGGFGEAETGTSTPQSVEVDDAITDAGEATTDGATTTDTATATEDGAAGAGNATTTGGDGPASTEGVTSEDQPGMSFVSALGGLLGLGELARRRIGSGDADAATDEDR